MALHLFVAALAMAAPADKLPETAPGQAWKLVWGDEFNGSKLDEKKWDVPEYKRRDAMWSRKAIEVAKGRLAIKMLKEGDTYYDACVRSKGKFEHAFGYYVARIRLQRERGHWPAFWLYNDTQGTPGEDGRNGSEIDIMEKAYAGDQLNHALHWDGYGADHKSVGHVFTALGILQGWHTFSLLWTPTEYVFYVDGVETWRTKADGVCQVPLYIKLSDEAQFEGWAGDLRKAKLPDEFLVDYVRVYDLMDAQGKPVHPVPATSIPKP